MKMVFDWFLYFINISPSLKGIFSFPFIYEVKTYCTWALKISNLVSVTHVSYTGPSWPFCFQHFYLGRGGGGIDLPLSACPPCCCAVTLSVRRLVWVMCNSKNIKLLQPWNSLRIVVKWTYTPGYFCLSFRGQPL